MAGKKRNEDGDLWGWLWIGLLFWAKMWPLALLLLFAKLFARDEKQAAPPPLQKESVWQADPVSGRAQGRTVKAVKKAAKKAVKSPKIKKSNALFLKIAGAVLACIGFFMTADAAEQMLWWFTDFGWWLPEMLRSLTLLCGGGAMLFGGLAMDRQLKRFPKYLSVMGAREAVSVEELSRTLGYDQDRVRRDVQKMIDKGYFGGGAYLNVELGWLFRSGEASQEWQRQYKAAQRSARQAAESAPPPPKEAEEGYSGILRNIRRANDDIADPVLSAKIDRLEEITARIFRAVEEDPKKRAKLDTFLNYYLPTTQKLLDSYASFEAAGVEGENLRQAKSRIEATMDAIVKGFEHQLDELYKADAMDVDSDIRVMEHMLRRDTATVQDDFGLDGGAAVQESEE